VKAIVGITFFLRSIISVTSVTAVFCPVAGGLNLRVSTAYQAIVTSNTLAEVALKVFSTASVTELSAKFLQLFTTSVTRLAVFKSVVYLKTSVFRIIKENGKFLASETGPVTGVECTHF
jgi:hypothetical protein